MVPDLDRMGLEAMIDLRAQLQQAIVERFERQRALAFTDLVGSTRYFQAKGNTAGLGLQRLHERLLAEVVSQSGGRIVDLQGDGAFSCFPQAADAVQTLGALQRAFVQHNRTRPNDERAQLRCSVHWGPVLTDGTIVRGDAVNLCARLNALASPGELLLSRGVFLELPHDLRLKCRAHGVHELAGALEPIEALRFHWSDDPEPPARVRLVELERVLDLPAKPVITFGRLGSSGGPQANDVVLRLPDAERSKRVSRWQFELRRSPEGYLLRQVSAKETEVDGACVREGQEAPVRVGSVVRVANVLTLEFLAPDDPHQEGETVFAETDRGEPED